MSYRAAKPSENIGVSWHGTLSQIRDLMEPKQIGRKEAELYELYTTYAKHASLTKITQLFATLQRVAASEINLILSTTVPEFYVFVGQRSNKVFLSVCHKRRWWFDKKIAQMTATIYNDCSWDIDSDIWRELQANKARLKLHKNYNEIFGVFHAFAILALEGVLRRKSIEAKIDAVIADTASDFG
jgi:hypothetical protein